ncbi:TFIIB-type zinc ribbon-containing protein [Goodfellowiella coeruleoviolacea]|uniref:Transcription factor zinc-finger domain-containing protein n=1 Tax=Goodfellowiella coeruleoviolacea TaxID=334858 RepID=A0AAE3GA36_9PSEU|nr:zf-TFIIB domain-containing protein [Goodfellowiella coeruleoviolacea]MCP2163665.1 hypothetical protein [Goodfellowiella coeruleoviolacea]
MICPKCQNLMQTVDRRGVHIEQCQGCRGIFLDRGELEQIANAERSHYGPQYAPPPAAYRHDSPPPYHGGYRDSPPPFRHGHADSPPPFRHGYADSPPPYGHQRRHRSFLEELFD